MRNSKYLQILGICTLFSVTACSSKLEIPEPPVYNKVRNISVDLNQEMQTIDGFGASDAWRCQMVGKYWPEEKRNQIADWLFSQEVDENGNQKASACPCGDFTLVREAQNKGLDSDIADEWRRSECFLSADGTYNWNKYEGQRWFFKSCSRQRG